MTVYRYGFHKVVMAYMLQLGESTVHIVFVACVIFMKAILSYLNLKPDDEFLTYRMPEVFEKTELGLTYITTS